MLVCVRGYYMYMLYRVTMTVLQSIYYIAPNDRMKEVLRKTISEAKAAVSKYTHQITILLTRASTNVTYW